MEHWLKNVAMNLLIRLQQLLQFSILLLSSECTNMWNPFTKILVRSSYMYLSEFEKQCTVKFSSRIKWKPCGRLKVRGLSITEHSAMLPRDQALWPLEIVGCGTPFSGGMRLTNNCSVQKIWKRKSDGLWTSTLGQLDPLTLCTELYLSTWLEGWLAQGGSELLWSPWGSVGEGWGGSPTASLFFFRVLFIK